MPKSLDKTKGAKKRKKTPNNSNANTESDSSESKPGSTIHPSGPKKKKLKKKGSAIEGIGMSKQLAAKVQNKRQSRTPRTTKNNAPPRVCGNGKPMPSLAELEAMYTDSEDDGDPPKPAPPEERCATPEQNPIIMDEPNLNSPKTLMVLTSKVIEIIAKKIDLDSDDVPKPIKPQKRPKKSDIPYIVGCREREQVPWAPKTKFCVGSEKYGVEDSCSSDEEDCCPKKRRRGVKMNLSKSIFNAKSDEIAERLKENENLERVHNCSPDSNETVAYELNEGSMNRSFEPLPSTSRDQETIMENEKRFNESLQSESLSNDSQNDIEVIEAPCETIVIDDTLTNAERSETIVINDTLTNTERSFKCEPILDDDCCIIVESETKRKKNETDKYIKTDSPQDDLYSSIDLTQTLDNEVYVIGDDDIDDVIAQNQAILGSDLAENNKDNMSSVIIVNPDDIEQNQGTSHNNSKDNIPQPSSTSAVVSNDAVNIPSNDTATNQRHVVRDEILNVVNDFFSQPQTPPSTNTQAYDNTSRSRMASLLSWVSSIAFSGRQNRTNVPIIGSEVIVEDNVQPEVLNITTQHIPNNEILRPNNSHVRNRVPFNSPSRRKKNNKNTQPSPSDTTPQVPSNISPQDSQPSRNLGDCPICMDSLASTTVASTICGHVFCMACIKAAVRANGKRCPTCRKALKGVGYHQLFL